MRKTLLSTESRLSRSAIQKFLRRDLGGISFGATQGLGLVIWIVSNALALAYLCMLIERE